MSTRQPHVCCGLVGGLCCDNRCFGGWLRSFQLRASRRSVAGRPLRHWRTEVFKQLSFPAAAVGHSSCTGGAGRYHPRPGTKKRGSGADFRPQWRRPLASVAQWQSSGFVNQWSWVQIPPLALPAGRPANGHEVRQILLPYGQKNESETLLTDDHTSGATRRHLRGCSRAVKGARL